MKYSTGYQN